MRNIVELFYDYQDNTAIFILAIISVIYLLSKAGKQTADYVYIAGMVLIVLVYNDLISIPVKALFGEYAYNGPACAMPVTIVCAVAAARFALDKSGICWKKAVFVISIVIAGLLLFRKDISPDATNMSAYSEQAAYEEMSKVISEDVKSRKERICNDAYSDSENIILAVDKDAYGYFRGLDGRYVMAYDIINTTRAEDYQLAEPLIYSMVVDGGQCDFNMIREMLSINCVEYAITRTEYGLDEYVGLAGYVKLGEYGKNTLYARDKECYPMRTGYWGYVRRVYFYLLGRRGTYEEVYSEIQKIGSQEQTLDEIAYRLLETEEFRNRNMDVDEAIEAIYHAIFYRDVTDAERYYWKEYVENGGNYSDMYHELYYNSGEFMIEWE